MKLSKETIEEFRNFAKEKAPEGYVCVGKGAYYLGQIFGEGKLCAERDSEIEAGCFGTLGCLTYVVTKERWYSVTGLHLKESIDSRYELAKSYVGKRIESRENPGKFGVVSGVMVADSPFAMSGKPTDLVIRMHEEQMSIHGSVVALTGLWENGSKMQYAIDSNQLPKVCPEPVKVNGFPAEDRDERVVFGCAYIDKNLLRDAKKFLESQNDLLNFGNKRIESVKIGAGDFTLDILNKLNL